MRIALYSPEVPRRPGGVSDHTLALARALSGKGIDVTVLASRGSPEAFAPISCQVGIPADSRMAAGLARAGASWVVLQYVPFLFARHGISPSLLAGLTAVRRSGVRIAVFVHEPFVPFTRLPWVLTGGFQRAQLFCILRLADRGYTPVPAWATRLSSWAGQRVPVTLAPVGATLPTSAMIRTQARASLGLGDDEVAIGVFSPGANAFRRDWVIDAWRAIGSPRALRWFLFGNGSEALGASIYGPTVATLGTVSALVAADTMRAMDLALAPYADGLTLRRTAAMFSLAHGVATVSSSGHLHDPALGDLARCPTDSAAFSSDVARLIRERAARDALGAAGLAGYRRDASVEALADLLIADLQPKASK